MTICKPWIVALMMATLLTFRVAAGEQTYYERFTEALKNGQRGFMEGGDLVNTNNYEPTLTNAPISFKEFTKGKLAGIKLGMSMSEVVGAWGKPNRSFSRCIIGPRFWYAPAAAIGDVSLSFVGDRLVMIGVSGNTARHLTFDNGLSGQETRADFERILGEPSLRDTEDLGLFNGQIAYRSGPLRMSFTFGHGRKSDTKEHLQSFSVCLEAEAKIPWRGKPAGASNRSQPLNPETNRASTTAGPLR